MASFDCKDQNALRRAIVFGLLSFVKNRSCVTQICITKIAAKCILVVVVKDAPSCKCPIVEIFGCNNFFNYFFECI